MDITTILLIISNSVTLLALAAVLIRNYQAGHTQVIVDVNALGYDNSITMNPNAARSIIGNYTQNHLGVINADDGLAALRQTNPQMGRESDSRCVWFPVNQLLKFLLEVKIQAGATCSGSVDTETLGVRIYYSEYPAADDGSWTDGTFPGSLVQYAGMHTIVFVPTYNNKGIDTDFDPMNARNTNAGPMPMNGVCGTTPLSLMLNHGSMCPPPFPVVNSMTGGAQMDFYSSTTGAFFLD